MDLTCLLCGVFESADRGGAYGYEAARLAAGLTDLRGGVVRNRIGLGVQGVRFDFVDADGLEGAEPNVEGDFCSLYAAITELGQNLRSEVEAGGGGGDGSAFARIDGLVAVVIGRRIEARNVRRQRDMPDFIDASEEVVHFSEADVALAKFAAVDYLGLEFVVLAEEKMLADSNFAAGADEAFPIVWIALQLSCEQDFDTTAEEVARGRILRAQRLGLKTGAASKKASGKYTGVVEYQQITPLEEIGQIAKVAVGESAGCGGHIEEARAGTIGQRVLGD